jgi:hypothetical protein
MTPGALAAVPHAVEIIPHVNTISAAFWTPEKTAGYVRHLSPTPIRRGAAGPRRTFWTWWFPRFREWPRSPGLGAERLHARLGGCCVELVVDALVQYANVLIGLLSRGR